MKYFFYKLLLIFFICFLFDDTYAQVKTKTFADGIPNNLLANTGNTNTVVLKPPLEFYKLKNKQKKESSESIKGLYKIALPSEVNIDFIKEAVVSERDGVLTYRKMISATDALNLSFQFNKFILSRKSTLSLYTKNELTDSITANENNENKTWTTRVYQGNILNIMLKVPSIEKGQSSININQVSFGYKDIGRFGNPGSSESCNINVA